MESSEGCNTVSGEGALVATPALAEICSAQDSITNGPRNAIKQQGYRFD
jgi:hypothetical protein